MGRQNSRANGRELFVLMHGSLGLRPLDNNIGIRTDVVPVARFELPCALARLYDVGENNGT